MPDLCYVQMNNQKILHRSRRFFSSVSDHAPFKIISFLVLILLIRLAYINAFIQDDAFISFRYASNLVKGHGLVWNPGERVEGYTNFLWTMLMAIPIALGYGPVTFSQILGLLCFSGSLIMTYLTASRMFTNRWSGLACVVLLGTNFTFSAYATGGLETQLQAFLVILAYYLLLDIHSQPKRTINYFLFSIIGAFAFLTRMDSALLFAVFGLNILVMVFRKLKIQEESIKYLVLLCIPAGVIITIWLGWKLVYYGSILPNTFYIKAGNQSGEIIRFGLFFLFTFFQSYFLIPILFLSLRYIRSISSDLLIRPLTGAIFLWMVYIILVGGDFMEFRFMVPILPLFFIFSWQILLWLSDKYLAVLFALMMVAGSLHHQMTFDFINGIETITALNHHVLGSNENWSGIGKRLYTLFSESNDVTIAVTAAGAIPFYSQLNTVDMLGLNDSWIARNTTASGYRPGHQHIAPLNYLVDRKVNLIIGHPYIEAASSRIYEPFYIEDLKRWGIEEAGNVFLPENSKMVEIPINEQSYLIVVYLTPNKFIDQVINFYHFQVAEIIRKG